MSAGTRLTIGDLVTTATRLAPARLAATIGREQYSFGQLDRNANRLSHAFRGMGIGQSDIVAWIAGAATRTLDGIVGVGRVGAILAPVNPVLPSAELTATLAYLRPRLVVADTDLADECAQICAELELPLAVFGAPSGQRHAGLDLDAAIQQGSSQPPSIDVDERLPHMVYLTSGSTGTPKGAVVTHRASWLRSAPGAGTFCRGVEGPGGLITGFPLFHYGGWQYVFEAWHNRRPIHLVRRATAEEMLDAIQRWRASGMYAIPAVWERILEVPAHDFDLSSVCQADTGTSFTSEWLLARIRERVPGTRTNIHYGSTEAGHMATLAHEDIASHPGSVGLAAYPTALWLGEDDEVLCSTPALMDGYLRRPDDTAAALRDGVYHSGDVGHIDDQGFLYLTGRTRELIRSGGESIWPVEVEMALRGLPGIVDLAVVGVPDDHWGEIVCAAVVVVAQQAPPDPATIRRHIADRLPPFKHPRIVAVMPDIPRTQATGQIRRRELVARIVNGTGARGVES